MRPREPSQPVFYARLVEFSWRLVNCLVGPFELYSRVAWQRGRPLSLWCENSHAGWNVPLWSRVAPDIQKRLLDLHSTDGVEPILCDCSPDVLGVSVLWKRDGPQISISATSRLEGLSPLEYDGAFGIAQSCDAAWILSNG